MRVVGVDAPEHGLVRVVDALAVRVGVDVHRQEVALGRVRLDRRHVPSSCHTTGMPRQRASKAETKREGERETSGCACGRKKSSVDEEET